MPRRRALFIEACEVLPGCGDHRVDLTREWDQQWRDAGEVSEAVGAQWLDVLPGFGQVVLHALGCECPVHGGEVVVTVRHLDQDGHPSLLADRFEVVVQGLPGALGKRTHQADHLRRPRENVPEVLFGHAGVFDGVVQERRGEERVVPRPKGIERSGDAQWVCQVWFACAAVLVVMAS